MFGYITANLLLWKTCCMDCHSQKCNWWLKEWAMTVLLTIKMLCAMLPFRCLSAYAVKHLDTKLWTAKPQNLQSSTDLLLSTGKPIGFSPKLESKSASCSISVELVWTSITAPMEPTHVPFVGTDTTPCATACETDLTHVLYIHMTLYNPAGWQAALEHCNLSDHFQTSFMTSFTVLPLETLLCWQLLSFCQISLLLPYTQNSLTKSSPKSRMPAVYLALTQLKRHT